MQRNRKKRYSKSQWEITRERLRIDDTTPPPERMNDRLLGDVIPALMKKFGLEEDHWINTLSEEWSDLMGTAVAAHSRPGELTRKRLTVYVDSSAWLYELAQSGRATMLENLNRRYGQGKITEVLLQLDPDASRSR